MLKLGQPYIEWSDGILSTGYLPIDRQHQWLLTIVNISLFILATLPSPHVLIHVNTGNQVEININDELDALCDYAWIHFTEEEALFMNNEYPLVFAVVASFTARSTLSTTSTRSSTLLALSSTLNCRISWRSWMNCARS